MQHFRKITMFRFIVTPVKSKKKGQAMATKGKFWLRNLLILFIKQKHFCEKSNLLITLGPTRFVLQENHSMIFILELYLTSGMVFLLQNNAVNEWKGFRIRQNA